MWLALGSLAFEVATMATEGAMALTMVVAGAGITMIHITLESCSFQDIVNRLTGCDLPESLTAPTPRETAQGGEVLPGAKGDV
jgi:hypothetical protein